MNPLFNKVLNLFPLPNAVLVHKGGIIARGEITHGTATKAIFVGPEKLFMLEDVASIHLEPDLITIELKS